MIILLLLLLLLLLMQFHSAAAHEETVIFYNYLRLIIVASIYIVCGMSYYVTLYNSSNIDDDELQLISPGYSWFRALYFLVVTMLGVGYGDCYPTTENSRLFTAFYILFGVCLGGTYVGLIISHIQEHSDRLADLRDKEIGRKLAEIHNRRFYDKMNKLVTNSIITLPITKLSGSIHIPASISQRLGGSKKIAKASFVDKILNDDNDDSFDIQDDCNESEDNDNDNDNGNKDDERKIKKVSKLSRLEDLDEYGLNKEEEHSMFDVSEKAFHDDVMRIARQFFIDLFLICVAIFVGMGAMIGIEGWAPVDAFYWAVVSIATVGYGDFHPTNNEGRLFTIFYLLIGTSILVKSLSSIVKIPSLMRIRRKEMKLIEKFGGEKHQMTPDLLKEVLEADLFNSFPMLKRNEKETSRAEFVILILTMMKKVKEKDIIFACKLFDNIDKNGDGVLDETDITEEMERLVRITHYMEGDNFIEGDKNEIKPDNV